jgi:hypothetical protein
MTSSSSAAAAANNNTNNRDNAAPVNQQHVDDVYDNNTMAMFIMAGMVFSAAGFTMYTKHAGSLLRSMNKVSQIQQGGGHVKGSATTTTTTNASTTATPKK